MPYDKLGQLYVTSDDLCASLYTNPDLHLGYFLVEDPEEYNNSVDSLYAEVEKLTKYVPKDIDVDKFDAQNQATWYMPDEYKQLDIAQYVLSLCKEEQEFQRVGQELIMFQERNLFDLLRFIKYLVDTMRKHNIVWGVGRGSSVASYVLFLIGIHKINSLYYDLPIDEFLK